MIAQGILPPVLLVLLLGLVPALAWMAGPPRRVWHAGLAIGALALMVGSAAAGSIIGGALIGRPWVDPDPPLLVSVIATGFGGLAASILVVCAADRRALGLGLPASARHWAQALAGLGGFLAFSTLWTLGLEAAGVEVQAQAVLDELLHADPATRALLVLYGAVGAPLFEELLFRGALVPPLARGVGPRLGSLLAGLLFGLAHLSDPLAVVPLVVLGTGLGLLRLRAGSILPGLVVHVVNNIIALASFWMLGAPG